MYVWLAIPLLGGLLGLMSYIQATHSSTHRQPLIKYIGMTIWYGFGAMMQQSKSIVYFCNLFELFSGFE